MAHGQTAALVLALVLYPPNELGKDLCWASVGVGLLVFVLAIWLLVPTGGFTGGEEWSSGSIEATVGIGAYLNVVAAAVVAIGGFLNAYRRLHVFDATVMPPRP